MRKLEYYSNKRIKTIGYFIYKLKFHTHSIKLGFSIPINTIGPGLAIVHYGTIVISPFCRIGANCRIHAGVNVGSTSGKSESAKIGNNVYLGPGAKIIGGISIGDNVVVAAGAVVVRSVDSDVTVGGVPAVVISDNNSSNHLIKATELVGGK